MHCILSARCAPCLERDRRNHEIVHPLGPLVIAPSIRHIEIIGPDDLAQLVIPHCENTLTFSSRAWQEHAGVFLCVDTTIPRQSRERPNQHTLERHDVDTASDGPARIHRQAHKFISNYVGQLDHTASPQGWKAPKGHIFLREEWEGYPWGREGGEGKREGGERGEHVSLLHRKRLARFGKHEKRRTCCA
jgi:hypothetical protein